MSGKRKIYSYKSMKRLVQRLRDDLNTHDFVLLFAYNGTGKTRLSMAFKEAGKRNGIERDTLYFNAFTEDLFHWENDLEGDSERYLKINSDSRFFSGFKELALEDKIRRYLHRYADFEFIIDYEKWAITFSRGDANYIKVSRGEENIFIWCIFLAICELTIDEAQAYDWVKNFYIDDPISSLDDNNAIAVSSDLAQLLMRGKTRLKAVISTHHGLFFNVMCNELKKAKIKTYFLYRGKEPESYALQKTDDTPFFHHVAILSELQQASESGKLYTHHFNSLRNILEKTAAFFGHDDFSACLNEPDEALHARALNLLSHGNYSVFEPKEMVEDNKQLFKNILTTFLEHYQFALPDIFPEEATQRSQP